MAPFIDLLVILYLVAYIQTLTANANIHACYIKKIVPYVGSGYYNVPYLMPTE